MAAFIAYGAATPDAIVAASSTHHGRLPLRSVSSESTGGASNWGGSAGVIKKRFLYTRQSIGTTRLISSPVELLPPFWFVPLHPNTMGDSPYVRFRRNRRGGASNWEGSAGVIKKRFLYTRQSTGTRDNQLGYGGLHRLWCCHP
jgi:hypothetical protein